MNADSMEETPIKGLYEIIAGDQVFYYSKDTGHVFFGEIWTKEGRSITAEKRKMIMVSKLKKLPLDLAGKTGSGPKTAFEFTDPDCPYCRKMDEFLSTRNDITRYTFFMPLIQIHPNAAKKAEYIITANDQGAAFKEVFSGKIQTDQIPADRSTKESQKRLADMERLARSMGVNGTPALWIEGVFVNGANTAAATKILDQ